ISFAPAIGPTLSGIIVNYFPWRAVFYVILPIAILNILFAYFVLKNITEVKNPRVDVLSIILSTLGFGGLLYGFSVAGDYGFNNNQVIVTLIFGTIALIFFIVRQLRLEQPILEFRVFSYKMFTLTTALGMFSFLAMIGSAIIMPLYMQNML